MRVARKPDGNGKLKTRAASGKATMMVTRGVVVVNAAARRKQRNARRLRPRVRQWREVQ